MKGQEMINDEMLKATLNFHGLLLFQFSCRTFYDLPRIIISQLLEGQLNMQVLSNSGIRKIQIMLFLIKDHQTLYVWYRSMLTLESRNKLLS